MNFSQENVPAQHTSVDKANGSMAAGTEQKPDCLQKLTVFLFLYPWAECFILPDL